MDSIIAARLTEPTKKGENPLYDHALASKLQTTARAYIDAGQAALNFVIPDFDAATDLVEMLAPVENGKDFAKEDRNHALHFRHPMTFIEMQTLVCFVTQILAGGETARTVEAQGEDDQDAADAINALLAWNDSLEGIYWLLWAWIWNAIVYNRGVAYESIQKLYNMERQLVWEDDITQAKEPKTYPPAHAKAGSPVMAFGKPVMVYPQKPRWRMSRVETGAIINHMDVVSPYDFICDPEMPLPRFQEGRFAGHRVMIPWIELERRSRLEPTDDDYVLPHVVKKLKNQKGQIGAVTAPTSNQIPNTTRTFYERNLRGDPATGVASGISSGITAGTNSINKDDGGVNECWVLTIRAAPKTFGIYDDIEPELIDLLVTANADVLALNIRNNKHNEYPYMYGEGRPNAHRQLSPGWALAIKPCQDRVDELNRTHADAQARMGNILLIDPTKCDVKNLLSPDKNGLMIFRTEAGRDQPAEQVAYQIPLTDTTARYPEEMANWQQTAENTSGAHAFVQGQKTGPDTTLGEFDAVKQMAQGRISDIARKLSEIAIKPQTRRFAMNFQQFMPDKQVVRVIGKGKEFDPDNPPPAFQTIQKADIQCGFDAIAHDGSLPGADAKIVAASSRALEVASNPTFAQAFDNTIPGAIDVTPLLRDTFKKTGLPVDKYTVTREQAQKNLQAKQIAAGIPPTQPMQGGSQAPLGQLAGPPDMPQMDTGAGNIPSAGALPPIPSAAPPQAHPGNV